MIKINGQDLETSKGTIRELLVELGINNKAVAVEVNLSIVRKKDYVNFLLHEGDRVEIVNFVGGG
ncbi:MAG: sulfur carrier protein ThiS [Nitrospirae bacterium]|nr:sulfur carrier protein ThiS [Nitrospirota bacterium]